MLGGVIITLMSLLMCCEFHWWFLLRVPSYVRCDFPVVLADAKNVFLVSAVEFLHVIVGCCMIVVNRQRALVIRTVFEGSRCVWTLRCCLVGVFISVVGLLQWINHCLTSYSWRFRAHGPVAVATGLRRPPFVSGDCWWSGMHRCHVSDGVPFCGC